jgi:rod shape determining protein RodA
MARRSWRSFDLLLLGVILLLAAYGVTMVYSATINTLGVEDSVRRQITFLATGIVLLLLTAAVDYRLLEIVQHPITVLTPLALALFCVALVIGWDVEQALTSTAAVPLRISPGDVWPIAMGVALVALIFLADRRWISKIDLPLTRFMLAVALIGAAAVAAFYFLRLRGVGSSGEGSALPAATTPYLLVGGLAVLYLLDCLTLRITDVLRNPLYMLMLILLGITVLAGRASGGAQRWLGAGTIQPSEPAKILTILVLAEFLADREGRMEQFSTVLTSLGIVGVPTLLIYLQPDLGTSLTLVAIWIAMIWVARIRLRHLAVMVVAALGMLPVVWLGLQGYMRERLMLFINPAGDPDGYFNVHQALVSIGSGGWFGKGLTHGTQSQLHFLRVRHTDFIFAVTAEELGFLGAVVMIALIFFALWRMTQVAEQSRDTFGRLIVAGVTALILFQSAINIGMNLGLLPVTGIPLPFVSYGGSSLITLMVSIGLVESVAMRHKKLEFD